jgi:hypothetical protein
MSGPRDRVILPRCRAAVKAASDEGHLDTARCGDR